jgi:hypothetical protein
MSNTFETTDIVLGASLKVLGYQLTHIEKNGSKGTFFFADVTDEVINDYDLGRLLVEPAGFNNAVKALTTASRR